MAWDVLSRDVLSGSRLNYFNHTNGASTRENLSLDLLQAKFKFSISVAEQAGLNFTFSETSKTGFPAEGPYILALGSPIRRCHLISHINDKRKQQLIFVKLKK